MGTTADKLNKLLETKEAIKQAIRDKGAYIGDHDAFAEYPDAIRSIETGSGESGEEITGSYIIAKFPDDMEEGNNLLIRAIELDMSNLNTSNVENMNDMFHDYFNLRELNLSNFNTENVKEMISMFNGCENLMLLDLSNWNTGNVTTMENMFNRCANLAELDLSSFNTSNVENMNYMFNECMNLEVLDIRNFDTSNVREMDEMFNGCENLHTLRLDNCNRNTIEKIIMFRLAYFPTGAIDGVTRKIYVNPDNIKGLTAPENWIFIDCITGEEIIPDEGGEEIPLYEVGMFSNLKLPEKAKLTEVNVMVNSSHFDLSNMFKECYNLTTINNIEQWDTSNVTNMRMAFYKCNNLAPIDLSSFNTSNVTNMGSMFTYCYKLTELDLSNFNTSKVTEMDYMFKECTNLTTINGIDQWNTYNVNNMMNMFEKCSSLTSLDLSNFNTSNVTNMSGMFWKCSNLEVLDIRNFDMSKIENISHSDPTYRGNAGMLMGCDNLRELRLDNCSGTTIRYIITSYEFPTNAIEGVTRKIYCQQAKTTGLTAPTNWVFEFVG